MEREIFINNICDYFDKADSGSKGALMHSIKTHFPSNHKISGSVRKVIDTFDLETLETLSGDCDYNRTNNKD